jgi:hypothetical protein
MLFRHAHTYVQKCRIFQTSVGREKNHAIPLQLVIIEKLFQQWCLDIIGEINPKYLKKKIYILTTKSYFTR